MPKEDRQRVVRAAFLRPINLAMLLIGGGFFAMTLLWWIIPLTLVTYTLLVVLAARDPLFRSKVLTEEGATADGDPDSLSEVSPERRARWLPRGETRRKTEEALVAYRKLVTSIEGSGEVTRTVLDDAVPKLHTAAERLVEVAHEREKAAEAVREIKSQPRTDGTQDEEQNLILGGIEDKITRSDEEISGTYDRLMTLRARMVGASLNSEAENQAAASELNRSLDGLNFRLEALEEMSSNPSDTPPSRDDEWSG